MARKGRFVGAKKGGTVCVVSSSPIVLTDEAMSVVEVPDEHASAADSDLITDFKVSAGVLRQRRSKRPFSEMKLALVGNWKAQCGIATYSESLWPELARRAGDFRLFIERNDSPTGPTNVIGDVAVEPEKVIPCWSRGAPLSELARAIVDYDPDVVLIQHEFGIWPHAGHWLALMSQLGGHRVIVTMHSVFHHRDKAIVEAAIPEIVVHLDGAKRVLKEEKGVPGSVYVIPHGCAPCDSHERLWNFYKTQNTLLQAGFGFEYKGWKNSIKTTEILKREFPDVFFTGLFSESPFNKVGHQVYHDELMRYVEELGLQDNVAIIRGYQSDASLDSYMRTNRAVLFPYVSSPQHEVFGASGAARLAMSKGVPVVTTSVNHFSDIPTVKADTPEDMAAALKQMFQNDLAWKAQVDRQLDYVAAHTWEKVAQLYIDLFEGKLPTA